MFSSPFDRNIMNNKNRMICLSRDRCCSLFSHCIVFIIGYQLGLGTSIYMMLPQHQEIQQSMSSSSSSILCNLESSMVQSKDLGTVNKSTNDAKQNTPISKSLNQLWHGAATVSRDDFIQKYDFGVPWDTNTGSMDVLLLYSSKIKQYPSSNTSVHSNDTEWPSIHYQSAVDATSPCDHMKVILLRPQKQECLAIVPQWESYHIHKFLRWKNDKDLANFKLPKVSDEYTLKHVSRDHRNDGFIGLMPINEQSDQYLTMLAEYIVQYNETIYRLKPLLEKIFKARGGNKINRRRKSISPVIDNLYNIPNNPVVIVMVCNYGQSELFLNFICNAKRKNLDLSKVLLFATDTEMYELAMLYQHLITVFNVGTSFGGVALPKQAARAYGDRTFTGMMFSKVYCVHLINSLGYDVLFQDVDVIWYQNPIKEFFNNVTKTGPYDIFFQDDGAHSSRYSPYSPNSGFYYVRNNARTRHFFSVFIRMGDQILASKSHQAVMNGLLADHSSSKGLRVKVFDRDSSIGSDFPGGFHYHKRWSVMKEIIQKQRLPYIFHMSWTINKDNKKKFYEQLGEWYLHERCVHKTADDIKKISTGTDNVDIVNTCCSLEPIITCHYKDKPSKSSCNDSPNIDQRGKPFW